jgi:membrane associated rhomboid family serine protease
VPVELAFVAGPHAGHTVVLHGDRPITLGSGLEDDLTLAGPGVSATHARLIPGGPDSWALQALGVEGTRVNGQALQGELRLLNPGDTIRLGPHTIVLRVQAQRPVAFPRPYGQPAAAPGGRRFHLLSCYVIVGLCGLVWAALSLARMSGAADVLDAAAWFVLNPQAVIQDGAWWQLVTYAFVHIEFWHVAFNCIALASFGGPFEAAFGARRFLLVFGVGVVASGLACMAEAYAPLLLGRPMHPMFVIGASGGVCAVLVCFAAWRPHARVILAFIPMRAWVLVLLLLGIDVVGLFLPGHGIAHSGHIGGTLAGLALCPYVVGRWPWRLRR